MSPATPALPCILLIGTADTKADELEFISQCIAQAGAKAHLMDVGVLGRSRLHVHTPSHTVAQAANTTLEALARLGDENAAMTAMALGAAHMAQGLQQGGQVQGVLILGGTMGTDLALDVAQALPLGFPKLVLSTVSFSHLIPPERLAPDLMMMLWAGGLYGLNSICKTSLLQAAYAVVGAAVGASRAHAARVQHKPKVAISSLGKSALSYMVTLKPELERRGFEVVVFHATGMGGQAMESLIAKGEFVCVLDLCLQEVGNHVLGSVVTSGAHRLEAAGRSGVAQIVAPGALDLIDVQTWAVLPPAQAGRALHVHNRLIASVVMTPDERCLAANAVVQKLRQAKAPVALVLPLQGIEAWDREGQPLHDPEGLAACMESFQLALSALPTDSDLIQCQRLDAHINDPAFCTAVLAIFDRWLADGVIQTEKK